MGKPPHDEGTVERNVAVDDLVVLVERGQARATIIIPAEASMPTQKASEFLVKYVREMSGAELPVVHTPAAAQTEHRVWIGMQPALRERFPDVDFSVPEPESLVMIAMPNDLVLLGRDEVDEGSPTQAGTLLSVLTFLQDRLGVRWLWPGPGGTDVIETDHIAFEPFEYRYHPQVRTRNPRVVNHVSRWNRTVSQDDRPKAPNKAALVEEHVGGYEQMAALMQEKDAEARRWLNMQRGNHEGGDIEVLHGSLRFEAYHAFADWHERFAADHPEWFALHPDGTRVSEQEDPFPSASNAKLCISNPEVAEQWLNEAQAYLEANPRETVVSASPNDNGWDGYCVCEDCKAWDSPDGPILERPIRWADREEEHYALTDRYVKFWNILARGLKERFPDRDVNVGVWAYHVTRPAPHARQLEDNIIVGYVGIRRRVIPNNSVEQMNEQLDIWRGWAEQGAQGMVWRPNSLKRNAGLPYVYMHRHGTVWNTLAENSMVGFVIDSVHHHWATQAPQFYVMTQLMWDPRQNVRDILDDFYGRAFGEKAAPYVDAYFAVFEQLYYKIAERYGPEGTPSWSMWSGIPHAYRELKLAPTLGRDMADHAWDNFLWEQEDARYTAEELAERYLQMAEGAVAEGPQKYRDRVAFLRVGLEFTRAQVDAVAAMNDLNEQRGEADEGYARAIEAVERRERILFENIHTFAFGYPQKLQHYRYRRASSFGPPPEALER